MYSDEANLNKGFPWQAHLTPTDGSSPFPQQDNSPYSDQYASTPPLAQAAEEPAGDYGFPSEVEKPSEQTFVLEYGQQEPASSPPMGGMSAPYPPNYTWEQAATGARPTPEPDEEEQPLAVVPPPSAPGTKKKKKRSSTGKKENVSPSAKEKKLAKKNKKKKAREQKKRRSMLVLKLMAFFLFGVIVGVQGLERVEAANALVGSTALPPSITESQAAAEVTPTYENNELGSGENVGPKYKYIDVQRLESKTPTDLAVWYMKEFPENKAKNENAFEEFQLWYNSMKERDAAFDGRFQEALAYVEQHPELLAPPVEEPAHQGDTGPIEPADPNATDVSGPISGDTGNQGNDVLNSNTGANSSSNSGENTSSGATAGDNAPSSSKFKHIDEAALNGFSAAQVANWVLNNFPPNGTNWNYQALGEYYDWLDAKGKKDATFVATVNGYLQTMGWSSSAG